VVTSVETEPVRAAQGEIQGDVDVTAIIPALNEEGGIGEVLDELRRCLKSTGWSFEIIVVDDGSTDRTAEVAREKGVRVVTHEQNRGYGAALKSGIRSARSEYILITDADGTYPGDAVPMLLQEASGNEMVVGARTGKDVHIPLIRRPAKWVLRTLAAFLADTRIPDLNSGLRVFRRDAALRFFPILPNGFSFTTTITLALMCNDGRVKYVSINYAKRTGRSKIRPIRDTWNFLMLIFRAILYFNPLKIFIPTSMIILTGFASSLIYDLFILNDLTEKTLILLFAGVQLLAVGILADMISKSPRTGSFS
jgi:glycosyltransferase involved in cell wall biosynthesis